MDGQNCGLRRRAVPTTILRPWPRLATLTGAPVRVRRGRGREAPMRSTETVIARIVAWLFGPPAPPMQGAPA